MGARRRARREGGATSWARSQATGAATKRGQLQRSEKWAAKPSNHDVTGGDKPQRGARTVGKSIFGETASKRSNETPLHRQRYGNMSLVVARWTSLRPVIDRCHTRRFLRPVGACHRRLHESWTASPPLHCGGNEGVSKCRLRNFVGTHGSCVRCVN